MRLRHRSIRLGSGILTAVLCGWSVVGCAPVFQDARLLEKGQAEITPSFSPTYGSGGGTTEHVSNNFGVHGLFGVSERVNLGFGYGRIQPAGLASGAGGINGLGFGPKFGLVKDRAALALPLTFAVGNGVDTSQSFQFHPTAIFTVPMSPNVDLNPSIGALVPFCDGCDTLLRLNLGVGLRPGGGRAVIRPEFGILLSPGDSGSVWTFGIGASIRTK
jgi:hypothetical protein